MEIKQWSIDFFDSLYGQIFMNHSQDLINKQAKDILSLSENKNIFLEQCCGYGQLAASISKIHTVKAFDFCENYINQGQIYFDKKDFPNLSLFKEDVLSYISKEKVDVCYNWYSSFGYFEHEKNIEILKKANQNLKNNGIFLLEYLNVLDVIKNFQKKIIYNKILDGKNYTIKRYSKISLDNMEMKQIWQFWQNKKLIKEHNTVLLLYTAKDLIYETKKYFKYVQLITNDSFDKRIIIKGKSPNE